MDHFQDRDAVRRRALVMVAALEPPARRSELESLTAPRDRYLAAAVLDELVDEGLLEAVNTGIPRIRLTDSGRARLLDPPGASRPYRVGLPGGEAGLAHPRLIVGTWIALALVWFVALIALSELS